MNYINAAVACEFSHTQVRKFSHLRRSAYKEDITTEGFIWHCLSPSFGALYLEKGSHAMIYMIMHKTCLQRPLPD